MKELLDSDRVNFLVWRFLLESNYRETAAKFQKEWQIQAPHRHFDFAPHVKNYALVSVLNKGLVYESLERDFIQPPQAPHDVPATTESMQVGVFGPLVVQPPHKVDEDDDEDEEAEEFGAQVAEGVEISRKRQMERQQHPSLPNGSPAKRQRLSHGCENGPDSATDAMEIDHQADSTTTMNNNNNNNHAYPSPLEGEQAASPIPRTDGPEQGTQIEKVNELSQETIFLRLTADEAAAETSPVQANQNPLVLHCEWNPSDPAILAAAGSDALARVWTVTSRTGGPENVTDHVDGTTQRLYEDLVEDDLPRNSTVTAMAWSSDGNAIAIANDVGGKTRVSIWGPDGTHNHRFDGAESPLIKLRWSPNNTFILGVAPDDGRTLVTLFSSVSSNSMSFVLRDHDLREEPLDTTWISESEFILCGGDHLSSLRFNDDGIVPHRQFDTRKDENFSQVQFDWRSGLLATSSDKGTIDLWDQSGQRRPINAHMGVITSLQWQPLQAYPPDDERLLASGGEDGAIFLWNVRSPDNRPKYSMTMENPVVALAFTPDGAFIAGATSDRILIWKVGDHQIPRASWSRVPHPGWFSPKTNGDQYEEDIHCLCWDATGQKLAYGANSRLAVINFR